MLIDNEIVLRPISDKDTDFILSMRNDLEIANNFFSDPPIYDFQHAQWLQNNIKNSIELIIEYQETKVGNISLTHIDYRNQKAEFGIMILQPYRKQHIATRAGILLLNYIFLNLPIQKIYLHVFEDNQNAIDLYKSLKFHIEGTFGKEHFKNGSWKTVVRMACFRENWQKKNN